MRLKWEGVNGWYHFGKRWLIGVAVCNGKLVLSVKLRPWRTGRDFRLRLWRLEIAV